MKFGIIMSILFAVVMSSKLLGDAAPPGPGFQIKNKSEKLIKVDVTNTGLLSEFLAKGAFKTSFYEAQSMGAARKSFFGNEVTVHDKEIDTSNYTVIKIFDKDLKLLCGVIIKPGGEGDEHKKKIYISWNGKKLTPQKGALKGVLGMITGDPKTEFGKVNEAFEEGKGYSLKNNVTEDELACKK